MTMQTSNGPGFLRRGVMVALAALVLAAPALADKGGKDKGAGHPGKGAPHSKQKGGGGPPDHAASNARGGPKKFGASERSSIQRWYRDQYASSGSCPPGLAKKNNGCMPPGQARKWNVGSRLPDDVGVAPLPPALYGALVAPAPGYAYGYVGGEVILYGTNDRVVIDVVAVF